MSKLIRNGFMIVVLGGATASAEDGCLKSIEISRNGQAFEPQKFSLHEKRRSPAVFYRDSKIIVAGGCKNKGEHLNSMEIIDKNNVNTIKPNVFEDGFSCSAFCVDKNNNGLVFGGFNLTGCLNSTYKLFKDNVEKGTNLSTDLKNATAVTTNDNIVYIIGGWDGKRTLDTVFTYKEDKLQYESRLPYSVEGHTSTYHNDFIVNIGGFDGISVISTISIYKVKTRKTEMLETKLQIARENHSTVIFEQAGTTIILVMGGWDGQQALKHCEAFKVTSESPYLTSIEWRHNLNEARNRPAAIVIPVQL
ncbi:unnamed protein product [Bursaphelenchus okinawaensis]|uniref:Uncharacterized protein n=1 Tax=Bursaphelenchus okinawaensis TaxID=465554 RepID=A0A811JUW2_9BILA|nr:unnamed protein product [Bursaphelenchus okinawaensis]CAG9083529.1 unnamed protein product [Bursaphelenchus okinawaensis]